MVLAVVGGLVRAGRAREPAQRPLRAALYASLLLFAAGGVIGFLIKGSDVRIPAHYHGAIVGITLAMMGLAYALMPRLGLGTPEARLATWQAWLYGSGQLLHIVGLVWSGGYGVQRKVAGAAQVLRTTQEVAGMSLMGIGGLIAVAGGVLFLVVVCRSILRRPRR
jgi:heme/copper-type cytochrome/quinol oxidase subunit 1